MDERIVINTGPVIALGKMGCLYLLEQLPYTFITPEPVKREIDAGTLIGRPVEFPTFVEVVSLAEFPSKLTLLNLDLGEAAVIQAAIELNIERVCIDEVKGRRAASASGLSVIGSLGLLGRAKQLGLTTEVRPLLQIAQEQGSYYKAALVEQFLKEMGEG
ncbi:MAG: DUF3368 domain-containing protein [Acidobacteria bacterium]|nr:DUF3368 domain-containing protein [Acidobacteriota bacterium]